MSEDAFRALQTEVFRLYHAQAYEQAWLLLEREATRFPEQASRMTFWRMCLAARSGDASAALAAFAEGVSAGHWWAEDALRHDSDLQSLQGKAKFERLVAICRERQAAAQAQARPELLLLTPAGAPPFPTIIALHGAGGTAQGFAPHWQPAVGWGWLVAVAQSSRLAGPDGFGWADAARAEQEISAHYQSLGDAQQVRPEAVVLAGYSQGGSAAIQMALKQTVPAAGFLGVACAARDLEAMKELATGAVGRVRGYLLVGDTDHTFERALALHGILAASGVPTELEVRPGLGHAVPDDFAVSLRRALAHITGSRQ